jgi:hypothetical protein
MFGRTLHTADANTTFMQLNIASLQPGVYFLRLEKEGACGTVRFVKQ